MSGNFASPQKIKASVISIKDKDDLYFSEATTMRLRCIDNPTYMIDGQKFLNQDMQGGKVACEKFVSKQKLKWVLLEKNTLTKSLTNPCLKNVTHEFFLI
jgi:hypothetical protein